ncbi:MAG: DUF881 domain-containing protein [Gracilibacteraceae bacterium]|jgi:uncharacterized protein YlxW (UPF0749 family)|nr:DUF881 domain-containing protein [Gracilibacteraceae bacterium]
MEGAARKNWPLTAAVFLVVLLTVTLLKSNLTATAEPSYPTGLPGLLQLEIENERLAAENERLRQDLTQLQNSQNGSALASEQMDTARLNAGQIELTGSGIRVTLDDALERENSGYGNYVIHEEYLRQLVNVLWSGGAEAIAINDQRVTGQTEIFCSGAFIQINGTRQSPPYKIVALGNQSDLRAALQFYFWDKLGYYQQQYGITRELEIPVQPLTVPAAKTHAIRFAAQAREGER